MEVQKSEISDEQLMRLAIAGNNDAFNEIYIRYSKRMLHYFYRMLNSDENVAQDFLQELFLKLIRNLSKYNPEKPFKTWLYSIAHNMCKNQYKKQALRNEVELNEELHELPTSHSHNETEFMLNKLNQALFDLDEEQRSIFVMFYKEGLRLQEISEIMELSPGTVKSRLHYSRKKIQAKLLKYKDLYYTI